MEKCTFCVQRIRSAKDVAKDDGRPVRDGEITPACVQTCPASALVFGDLKDTESKVSKLAQDSRRYRILEELNTEPAVTYLKKIRHDTEV
jgi:molybdopterin-containing oxidoreductase family iron-sulfur binding subunit